MLLTDAIVLHVFDYLENSRIYRLATREAGLQSVLARGARSSRKRFGSALGLFAGGRAEMSMAEGRDLQTLNSFDVSNPRIALAEDYSRFLGASLIAEIALRFSSTEAGDELFDAIEETLDRIANASAEETAEHTIAGAWRLVSALGFSPTIRECASCHTSVPMNVKAPFSHRAGGIICANCKRAWPTERSLPSAARNVLDSWLAGTRDSVGSARLGGAELRAHARLLREFVREHMGDDRPLKAFEMWERERLEQ
jgi:DNA repair protein RecO (recombination protein O)